MAKESNREPTVQTSDFYSLLILYERICQPFVAKLEKLIKTQV